MFALVLGLSWLVLTPLCVWMLFSRGRRGTTRVTAALTLAALQAGTVVLGMAGEHQDPERQGPGSSPVAGRATPSPSSSAGRSSPSGRPCAVRALAPSSVRLSRRDTGLDGMTVYWAASPQECGTASVALRPDGRRLRIWLREGAARHEGAHILPVRVTGDLASLDLRLSPPLRPRAHYVAVDARTGQRIPEKQGT
jgi:hypothetical protein